MSVNSTQSFCEERIIPGCVEDVDVFLGLRCDGGVAAGSVCVLVVVLSFLKKLRISLTGGILSDLGWLLRQER